MKILIKADETNPRVMEGLHNAAFDSGFSSLIWNERTKPSFDAVHEFTPDLVICYGDTQGSAIESACNHYSVPLVNISPTKIEGDMLATFHKPSADLLKCNQDKSKENNIITLSEVDNRQILKLAKFGIKCFSYNNKLNSPSYLGVVSSEESHQLLCNSKMFFVFNDDWELMCNCIASDCIPILFNNSFVAEDILPVFNSQQEIESGIEKIISDDDYTTEVVSKLRDLLFSGYTYHHRLSEVLSVADKKDECNLILERLGQYK
jgi:hypothetical protein